VGGIINSAIMSSSSSQASKAKSTKKSIIAVAKDSDDEALVTIDSKGNSTEKVPTTETDKKLQSRALMSGLRARASKITKRGYGGGKAGRGNDVYHISLTSSSDVVTNSSGVYSVLRGATDISTQSDWSNLINLFDVVRCSGLHWHFEPVGAFVWGGGLSGKEISQPQSMCGDDDAVVAVAHSALVLRDLMDKRNHYSNTFKSSKGFVLFKKAFNVVSTSPVSAKPTLPQWMDTAAFPNAGGGLLHSIRTEAQNVSLAVGQMRVCYLMEWSTQL